MSHPNALQQAIAALVHDAGAGRLAQFTGKSPATVANEANPEQPGHKLGLEDAALYMTVAGDFRILDVLERQARRVAIALPGPAPVSDVEILTQFSGWQAYLGRTCQSIHHALEDGRITRAEISTIQTHWHAHMRKGLEFLARLEAISDD